MNMAHGEGFLEVYLHGVLAGKLIRTPERLVFEYEPEYLERADARALSRRLPPISCASSPITASDDAAWPTSVLSVSPRRTAWPAETSVSTSALVSKA